MIEVYCEGGPLDGVHAKLASRSSRLLVEADDQATDAGFRACYRPTRRKHEELPVHTFDGWTRVVAEIPAPGT